MFVDLLFMFSCVSVRKRTEEEESVSQYYYTMDIYLHQK